MPRTAPVSYQLHIEVARALDIAVGCLGQLHFAPGRYVYSGSARRNLEARIARHVRREKKLHWHIDWLLAAPGVRVVAVTRSPRPECELARRSGGSIPAPGFGASDCRAQCGSHLRRIGPLAHGAREALLVTSTPASPSATASTKRRTPSPT